MVAFRLGLLCRFAGAFRRFGGFTGRFGIFGENGRDGSSKQGAGKEGTKGAGHGGSPVVKGVGII